jgi:hypothetical protein
VLPVPPGGKQGACLHRNPGVLASRDFWHETPTEIMRFPRSRPAALVVPCRASRQRWWLCAPSHSHHVSGSPLTCCSCACGSCRKRQERCGDNLHRPQTTQVLYCIHRQRLAQQATTCTVRTVLFCKMQGAPSKVLCANVEGGRGVRRGARNNNPAGATSFHFC